MTISWSSSRSPSISAWTSTLVRSSVGFSRRSAISLPQRSKTSGTSRSITVSAPSGVASGSPAPSDRVHQARPDRVVLGREAHEAADHARDDRLRDVGRRGRSPRGPRAASSTSIAIARIASSCSAIRFGVKPRWKSALIRSCLGGSMPMNIACWSSSGRTAFFRAVKPPTFGGVGLPVAADLVDVVGRRHRPEAVLVRDTR